MAKDIEPKLKLISDYLKLDDNQNFVIPEYQRGYSWNISQCDKLWQDIEAFIETDSKDPYFFGTIIINCSDENKYSLIDGQQRTTTFLLLLKALLLRLQDVLDNFQRDSQSEALEEGLKENRNKIIRILYKAEVEKRFEILKNWNCVEGILILENLSINEQYKEEVKQIIESKNFQVAEKIVHKIPRKQKENKYTNHFRNFKFFHGKLFDKSESQLNTFAKIFLEKCQVIEIRSWQIEQAITMFNSLNSTGMPLSDADIISAQLYSNAGNDKSEFNIQWESINKLASDLNSRKLIDIDGVLQQFMYINRANNKEYLTYNKEGKTSINVTTPGLRRYYTDVKKELLSEPLELCSKLSMIVNTWNEIKDYSLVKLLLKFNENTKLFLASYLFRYDLKEINKEKIEGMIELLLRLFTILELSDIGYSSSKFKTFLFGENIKLVDKNITIESIEKDFNEHIKSNWDKQSVEEAIIDYEKNILVFLNEYLYSKENNIEFDFAENVNIEHIMPASGKNISIIRQDAGIEDQEEFLAVVNKLGNKILLEENINKSIGNEWFKTKKQTSIKNKSGYKDSSYSIAIDLTNYPKDTWTKEDIEDSTKKSVERIKKFIFNE